ncbi:MAG: hypothetical protein Q4F97_01830 [Bacteroidales bacterium]|nr:hypothetical protein [Bacteroidales bacterium]
MNSNLRYIILTIIIAIAGITDGIAQSQIQSPIYINRDSIWYSQEAAKWKDVINKQNDDENAWENYYKAMRYALLWSWNGNNYNKENVDKMNNVLSEMKKAIPDSFTFHLYNYYNLYAIGKNEDIEKAMEMKPESTQHYDIYAGYLLMLGDFERLNKLYVKWYNSGKFSIDLINYFYNEIASADKGSIIFVNGDAPVYADGVIQNGLNLFKDVTVVCLSVLPFDGDYREKIFKSLNIKPNESYSWDKTKQAFNDYCVELIKYIAKESGRSVYLSSTMNNYIDMMKDSLYSEGLLFKYSTKPYDNIAKTDYNFTNIYLTDYLIQSFSPEKENASVSKTSLNFVVCLKSLLSFYKISGNKNQYDKLYKLLSIIIEKNSDNLSSDLKQQYLKCLE